MASRKSKFAAREAEIRLGGVDIPAGFVSLDELADNVRAISKAVGKVLNDGPLTRRAVEVLILDQLPHSGPNKIGLRVLQQVLDALVSLKSWSFYASQKTSVLRTQVACRGKRGYQATHASRCSSDSRVGGARHRRRDTRSHTRAVDAAAPEA